MIRSLQSFWYTAAFVCAAIPAARAAYPDVILGDQPVAYYRLEELSGATATDSGPNHFDAVYVFGLSSPSYPVLGLPGLDTNAPLFLLYRAPNSFQYYGYVDVPFQQELSPVTGDGQHGAPFSAECWVQPVSQPADYSIPLSMLGRYEANPPYGNASGWNFYQSPGPNSFWILNVKNGPFAQVSTLPIELFKWYHLAVTYDGSTFIFYINGTAQFTQGGNTGYYADHHYDGQIGAGDNSGFLPFNGSVDEVAFYTNVLTAAQITNHYATGLTSFVARSFPPMVLQDPASATVNSGSQAKFTAIVDGATPLSYQWLKGGSVLDGATTNPLAFTATYPADDNTSYSLIVTNLYGGTTSAVAVLTVQGTLNIDHQPFSITRTEGTNSKAAFRVAASGSQPLRYQWFKVAPGGGTTNAIAGATNDTLWVSGLNVADSGSAYYAVVTNAFVVTSSDQATLTVNARTVTVPITGYARFVVGDDPVAYWRLDETTGLTAVDAVGSFDGTYSGNPLTLGYPTGIPHETDAAIHVTNTAILTVPYALELNPVTGPWSAEFWIQPTSLDASDFHTPISSEDNALMLGTMLSGWNIYQHVASVWTWNVYSGGSGGSFSSEFTDNPIVPGQWYHMVLTDDLTNMRWYSNGRLVLTMSRSGVGFVPNGINGDPSVAGGPFTLGVRSDGVFGDWDGGVDDVAVYNYPLSQQQVQNHFLNNVSVSITKDGQNVVLSWPGAGLTLQSSTDVRGSNFVNVPLATSPYTNAIANAPKYYRLKLQ